MKKILIYPICLITGAAVASTTFYYDKDGKCTGLFIKENATSCSQSVTKIVPPTSSKYEFQGYWAGNTKVIDEKGYILIDGADAAKLFDGDDSANRQAQAGFAGYGGNGHSVLVKKHIIWDGYNVGWYMCSGVQFQICYEGEDFVLPYAPNCWSFGTNPINTGYDYEFNSWRLNDIIDGWTFEKASSVGSWHNDYPNDPARGDSIKKLGCTDEYLNFKKTDVSDNVVQPFACKLFEGTRSGGKWPSQAAVANGAIVLDNSTAGTCEYTLQCDSGYTPSSSRSASVQCRGTRCRGYFDGKVSTLISRGLTATCVRVGSISTTETQ